MPCLAKAVDLPLGRQRLSVAPDSLSLLIQQARCCFPPQRQFLQPVGWCRCLLIQSSLPAVV
ncbi:hypothetical protein, partial [Sedimenticola selenatireducens]|uniref:hypothetical protein n=1 Tax=Sedimenticola selenatireducens TaxID=191960 RepID=UPI003F4AD316